MAFVWPIRSTGIWTASDITALQTLYPDLTVSVDGNWASSGGRDMNHSSNPRFTLDLAQQATVELNLTSNIDTYLYLLDQSGNLLYQDDDGGVGYNSRLSVSLAAGQYILVAATYSPGQSGAFTISSS